MATDNIDIFKKVIFQIPSSRKIIAGAAVTSLIFSLISFLAFKAFAGNLITSISPWTVALMSVFIFFLPLIFSGELLYQFIDNYPRNWGLFLNWCNQAILFIYLLLMSGADSFGSAWTILWISVVTVYISSFVILLLTLGYKYLARIGVLSAVQPVAILIPFHLTIGSTLNISASTYIWNLVLIPIAMGILVLALLLNEYLFKSNVSNVSAIWLTSALFQKKQEELDLGYRSRPEVQSLEISNESGEFSFCIPWIHPGPLEGFGGGRATSNIIEKLNEKAEGFFLHVPSTHKSDPTDPKDYQKILEAMKKPEKRFSNASKLFKKKIGETTFYGRKFNDKKVIYLDNKEFDDFESSVFKEILDLENTVLVDLHNHPKNEAERKELWYGTEKAEKIRKRLKDFIEELEEKETPDYKAGFSADIEGKPVSALIEEVKGQKTVLFGVEGNEKGRELQKLEEQYRDKFDEVLVFSTDTHQSIHDLSKKTQVEISRVRSTVKKAEENLSSAAIGLKKSKTEPMNLLQEDYSGLIFSINILVRSLGLTLIMVYLGLLLLII